jgi:hypothetical protein
MGPGKELTMREYFPNYLGESCDRKTNALDGRDVI